MTPCARCGLPLHTGEGRVVVSFTAHELMTLSTEDQEHANFDDADDMRMFFECLTYARERAYAVMPEAA